MDILKRPNIVLILLSLWSQVVIIALIMDIRIAINFPCLQDFNHPHDCINSRAVYDCLMDITFQRMGFTWWVKSFSRFAPVPHHWFLLDTVTSSLLTVTFETCVLCKVAWNNMFPEKHFTNKSELTLFNLREFKSNLTQVLHAWQSKMTDFFYFR